MNPFPFVMAEWRACRATLLAMAALVAVSCAISLALTSVERGIRQASNRAADRFDLVVGAAGSEAQLVLTTVYLQPSALKLMPLATLEKLRATPGVEMASPVATGDSYAGFPIVGTSLDFASNAGSVRPASGRWFSPDELDAAVVGALTSLHVGETYTPLHGSAQDNAIERHEHRGDKVRVVGKLAATGTPWDHAIVVPFEAMLALHAHPAGEGDQGASIAALGVPAIVVKPHSVMDAYRLRTQWRSGATTAVFPAETLTQIYRSLGDARELAWWIATAGQVLVLAAVLLGVYAMLAARAAGLLSLRAIGAGRLFVALALWLQVASVLVIGLCGGIVGGWLLAKLGSQVLAEHLGLALSTEMTRDELWPMLSLLLAGTLAAAGVAWQAYRRPLAAQIRR